MRAVHTMLQCCKCITPAAYMRNLKYDTNALIHKTEADSQTQRADLPLPWGTGVGSSRSSGLADTNWKEGKQRGPSYCAAQGAMFNSL